MGVELSKNDTPEDMRIQVGDVLEILEDNGNGKWLVRNQRTGINAYVPKKYKQESQDYKSRRIEDEISAQDEPWFFEGIRRVDSERLLKRQRGNVTGSFLVRRAECLERPRDEFSLSILGKDNSVVHYKIFRDEKGMFHVNRHEAFSSLQNLITKYLQAKKINNDIHLTVPCVRDDGSYEKEGSNRPEKAKSLEIKEDIYQHLGNFFPEKRMTVAGPPMGAPPPYDPWH